MLHITRVHAKRVLSRRAKGSLGGCENGCGYSVNTGVQREAWVAVKTAASRARCMYCMTGVGGSSKKIRRSGQKGWGVVHGLVLTREGPAEK